MQDLLAARFWIGMGSGILAALPSARAAAIELFAHSGRDHCARERRVLKSRAVNGDGDHERLLFCIWNWSSQSPISCLFVPLPRGFTCPLSCLGNSFTAIPPRSPSYNSTSYLCWTFRRTCITSSVLNLQSRLENDRTMSYYIIHKEG